MRSGFKKETGFCGGADSVIKMFNQKLFALDATMHQLHIFDTALSTWHSKSLTDYRAVV